MATLHVCPVACGNGQPAVTIAMQSGCHGVNSSVNRLPHLQQHQELPHSRCELMLLNARQTIEVLSLLIPESIARSRVGTALSAHPISLLDVID